MEKRNTIVRAKERNNDHTCSIVEVIGNVVDEKEKEGYFAKFVVGTTFGTDLSKWREILHTVFDRCDEVVFNDLKKFENAILITDPIRVDDKDGEDSVNSDNLKIILRGSSKSYLHSKIILIRFDKKKTEKVENNSEQAEYVLFVSSKNISYSRNFDQVITLYSDHNENNGNKESENNGREVYDYLSFLIKEKYKKDIIDNYEELCRLNFDVRNSRDEYDAHIRSIKFSYEDHWFPDKIWEKVLKSNVAVSPYLSEEELKKWIGTGNGNDSKQLLSYVESLNKISGSIKNGRKFFVGGISESGARYKFHTKMYSGLDENNTYIIMGSANLTEEGKKCHYEVLVELVFEDGGEINNYIKNTVINVVANAKEDLQLIVEYKINEIPETEEPDDENINSPDRMSKYALYRENNMFIWKKCNEKKIRQICEPFNKEKIRRWADYPEMETRVYICEENYYVPSEEKEDGYIKYDDFCKYIADNIKKNADRYYRQLFMSGRSSEKSLEVRAKRSRKNKADTKVYTKYPCLFRCLMETRLKKDNDELTDEDFLKNELKKYLERRMDSSSESEIVSLMKGYVNAFDERDRDNE